MHSSKVISTLLKARKLSTNYVYTKVWNKFKSFSTGKCLDPTSPSSALLLDFLQAGLDFGLRLSSLKVQVVAISSATQKRWVEDLLIIQFFRAVEKIRPPVKRSFPAWELSFVLDCLMSQPPPPPAQYSSL